MRWWKVIARILDLFNLKFVILDREHQLPYMTRYYLFSTRFLEKYIPSLSYRIVIHNMHQSDSDFLHNHPWCFYSRILEGGYWECVEGQEGTEIKIWRDAKTGWRYADADFYHRLELDPPTAYEKSGSNDTWTIFIMGPRQQEWGFKTPDGRWFHYETWFKIRNQEIEQFKDDSFNR